MTAEFSSNPEHDNGSMLALAPELRKRAMFCLHGVALDSVGRNTRLPEDTTLEERFRMAIVNTPALSAVVHTESATTSKVPLWSNVGVMIGDGRVQAASPADMGTVMLDEGRRRAPKQPPDEVRSALDQIAANDARYADYPMHNEIVVSDPVITGLYFKDTAGLMDHQINRRQVVDAPNTIPRLIREVGAEFGLPIFAIRTSGVYEVGEFDPTTGLYKFSSDSTVRVHAAEIVPMHKPQSQAVAFAGGMAMKGVGEV